jgi:endonuclease YncB( thermonuclease family)
MRLAALTALLVLALATPAAHAWKGPCRGDGGPQCTFTTARVVHVHDGDTIEARAGGRNLRVRITGIQAMEMRVYSSFRERRRGTCHAVAATNRLERLLGRSGRTVRLGAQDAGSRSGKRLRRTVAFRRNGRWVDAGSIMVAEGHVLWLSNPVEWAWNATYARLSEQAQARGKNLWNPTTCGAGPAAGAELDVHINWDADGVDVENPGGEWFRLSNRSAEDVALGGWSVRDSALRSFTFPSGAVVRAGRSVTVYVGRGQAREDAYFWGQSLPVFENVTGDGRGVGDGGYLFDPAGDLRAFEMYH